MNNEEIKEISKVDKKLLDKIEHILGSELSSKEYDVFYNYFNEIRKPNILIDIKDDENIKDYITNLQEENKRLLKIKKYAEDVGNKRNELYERIDKAIEVLKTLPITGFDEFDDKTDEVYYILQGEDK